MTGPSGSLGRTLLLVTQHANDIMPQVGRVVLLAKGSIVANAPKSEILTAVRLSELYGFDARVGERGGWYRLWWEDE